MTVSKQCMNGGTLVFLERGNVECKCTTLYTGARCENQNIGWWFWSSWIIVVACLVLLISLTLCKQLTGFFHRYNRFEMKKRFRRYVEKKYSANVEAPRKLFYPGCRPTVVTLVTRESLVKMRREQFENVHSGLQSAVLDTIGETLQSVTAAESSPETVEMATAGADAFKANTSPCGKSEMAHSRAEVGNLRPSM
ncbi:hypothetical protein M514_02051 [Trichuris suis]|uniref:EGF-like domain-containing protein n=1 Tax=Trichuris suis TaxID=68888 RepID=A0A085MIX0_9BILA|nr:hypothetical protein M513_02051 [Trichuris suis]KFD63614.1 hypothetical protein M514_02051 [Trichuris suis]